MKKILFASAMALAMSASLSAKTADELRVYINPGHGAYTSSDRPMNTIREVDGKLTVIVPNTAATTSNNAAMDTTAFYESNTNLRKGFGVLDELVKMGLKFDRTLNQDNPTPSRVGAALDMSNNVVMSHVKTGPYPHVGGNEDYSRSLSEIAHEVDINNFDMFISIHSNAATEGTSTNYPLFLYRGQDTPSEQEGCTLEHQVTSKAMADAAWKYAIENPHAQWTNYTTSKNLRGDWSFYKSSSTNGYGYRGYLGVLKHGVPGYLVEGYFHTYQVARHRAMNYDVDYVEGIAYSRGVADYWGLTKPNEGVIYGIARDRFEKFSHDCFIPNASTDDIYKPLNNAHVVLKNQAGEVVAEYDTDNNYNGAFVFRSVAPGKYSIVVSKEGYIECDPIEVEVKASQNVYPLAWLVSESYVAPTDVPVDYPDPLAESGQIAPGEFKFKENYVDQEIAELEGKTVQKMLQHKGLIYILARDAEGAPSIVVYNPAAKEVFATPAAPADLGDIAITSDGYLVAGNKGTQAFGGANNVKVYKWEKNSLGACDGDARTLGSFNHAGNWNTAEFGQAITYVGTLDDGEMLMFNKSASNDNLRYERIQIVGGAIAGYYHNNFNSVGAGHNNATLGSWTVAPSPRDLDNIVITSTGMQPVEIAKSNASAGIPSLVSTLPAEAASTTMYGANYFKYADASYMVGANANGVEILKITDGLDNAKAVATNIALDADGSVGFFAAVQTEAEINELDEVVGAHINAWYLRGNKLSAYTTQAVKQPIYESAYAYDLKAQKTGKNQYDISFKVSAEAVSANLIVKDGDNDVVIPLGAVVKGDNTFPVVLEDLEGGNYAWSVQIIGKTNTNGGLVFQHKNGLTVRGGVAVITEPQYASFGYTAVASGKNNGITVYAPDHTVVGTYFKNDSRFNSTNQSSLFRAYELDGKAVFCDWSDKGSGYWVFDPANPTADLHNMLLGTNNGTGAHVYNGSIIGGGSSCVAFQHAGDNLRMYTFIEDWPTGNGNNQIVRYDLGTSRVIDHAPDQTYNYTANRYFVNANVDIVPCGEGFFASQCRSAGNDAVGVPCFIYSKIGEDTPVYNSGSDLKLANGCSSGIAVSPDGKLFAAQSYSSAFIHVFDLTWTDKGVPVLTHKYDIPALGNSVWSQIKFDYAGNIHVFDRDNNGYAVYAIPAEDPTVSTPAMAEYALEFEAEPEFILGDANGDGDVSVADVVYVCNKVLDDPAPDFVELAGDIDGDGDITVTDIVLLVNMITGVEDSEAAKIIAKAEAAADSGALYIDSFTITAGETMDVEIKIDTPDYDITAFQVDITMPEGLTIEEDGGEYIFDITDRAPKRSGHQAQSNTLSTGIIRVLCYSSKSVNFDDREGAVLVFPAIAAADFKGGDIELTNIEVVEKDGSKHRLAPVTVKVSETSGVELVGSDNAEAVYYNLNGARVANPVNGVYIKIRGNKAEKVYVK